MRFYKIIPLILCLLLITCTKGKTYKSEDFKDDSIAMRKKYDSIYFLDNNRLNDVYLQFNKSKDSAIIGGNNQLYSDYLLRSTKYDSAYFYLKTAENYFKYDTIKLFHNAYKKVYLTNRVGLLTQSEIELERIDQLNIKDQEIKKLFKLTFSLPVVREKDSLQYIKNINTLLRLDRKIQLKIKKIHYLDNYITNQTNSYLLSTEQYNVVLERANKQLNELIVTNRTNEDIFFSVLYYIISAKTNLKDATVTNDFVLFDKHLKDVFTKETEAIYYIQKAKYFETINNLDSVKTNYMKALDISKNSGNFIYERDILKMLMTSKLYKSKQNAVDFIKINDSLLSYKSYLDDFIFSTNSQFFKLKSEQKSILQYNLFIVFFIFIILFSSLLYFLIVRNRNYTKNAQKQQEYLDEKSKMYKYLIDIKERMDINILRENNAVKELIYLNTIAKIDVLLNKFQGEETDTEKLQIYIKEIEDESRKISHVISASEYKAVDIEYFLKDIKNQYSPYFTTEIFIDSTIVLNDLGFKTLLRILLFTHKLLNKFKYKENLNCFISIYKKDHAHYYKIYLNKKLDISSEFMLFLEERMLDFKIEKQPDTVSIIITLDK